MAHPEFEDIAALYAVGAATVDEERALDEHTRTCGDCRQAQADYAEASTLIARELDPVVPPPQIRERVFAGMDEPAGSSPTWWLATAATLFLALWGWREFGMRVMREHYQSQQAEIQRLNDANRTLAQQRERLTSEMAALAAPGAQTIALNGQQVAPSASARVFLEPDRRRAVVFFSNLPANSADKSYQLWIIRGDQEAPQNAGVFDVEKGTAAITIENLPIATEIKGLAVTLEKRGGAEKPSSAEYYVLGKV